MFYSQIYDYSVDFLMPSMQILQSDQQNIFYDNEE